MISSNHVIELCWIPAHKNIVGNDKADNLAKLSLDQHRCETVISREDMTSYIKKRRFQEANDIYKTLNTKLHESKDVIAKRSSSYRDNRREEVVLTRLRIGHSLLTHGHLITKQQQAICTCGEILTVKHILCECNSTADLRDEVGLFSSLLGDLNDEKRNNDSVFEFLKKIDLYKKI